MLTVLIRLFAWLFLLCIFGAGGLLWFASSSLIPESGRVEFNIRVGSSLRSSTQQIIDGGLRVSPLAFNLLARVTGKASQIKAGPYEITGETTPWALLGKITRGEFSTTEITFIEGWTFRQMRTAIDAHPYLQHDSRGISERDIMNRLGLTNMHPEGWFFPDTYLFPKGESDFVILAAALTAMKRHLDSAWKERSSGLPLKSSYEALILASIVEKETGRREDRNLISAVFLNRLRMGMRLQTDPSVIYGLGERFDGNLRRRDLDTDNPFNTYLRAGLPPHPIAMPGRESLLAAMNPAHSDALYFVARGDGSSEFSLNLEDHNSAVRRYQLKKAR